MAAKDRAKDSRRVFKNPMSHVKVRDVSERYSEEGVDEIGMGKDRPKYDAFGKTDFERTSESTKKAVMREYAVDQKRSGKPGTPYYKSDVPVVKIKS